MMDLNRGLRPEYVERNRRFFYPLRPSQCPLNSRQPWLQAAERTLTGTKQPVFSIDRAARALENVTNCFK